MAIRKLSVVFCSMAAGISLAVVAGCSESTDPPVGGTGAATGGTGAGTAAGTTTTGGMMGATGGTTMSGGTGAGTGGMMGATGGTGGDTTAMCVNPTEPRTDCPDLLQPMDGPCAPHGECCHRDSAATRIASLTDPMAPAVSEYRLVHSAPQNHPGSLGTATLQSLAAARARTCSGEQCLLWRFTEPRMGGQRVDGMGTAQFGIGRYNCDGTYSYYGDAAAPMREGHTDPARWAGRQVNVTYSAAATEFADKVHINFADNANRGIVCSPFVDTATYELDWELCSSGFEILTMDTTPGSEDCKGSYDGVDYIPGGQYQVFAPIFANLTDGINALSAQTFCQLLSFGITGEPPNCMEEPRCMPGSDGCPWIKLPDSLCPVDEAERAIFGCHLGDTANVNGEADYPTPNCTAEAPTTARDPDMGVTDEGQCCDPMGMDPNLPACNAFRIVNNYVAASVQITDDTKSELGPNCLEMQGG